jgi:hypothetical protein
MISGPQTSIMIMTMSRFNGAWAAWLGACSVNARLCVMSQIILCRLALRRLPQD